MPKGFGADSPTNSHQVHTETAPISHPIRITFAPGRTETAPSSHQLAPEPTHSCTELANLFGWPESTVRKRMKTVLLLATQGVLAEDELLQGNRYTDRAKNLLESLGAALADDRMAGPRWLQQQAEALRTFAAMNEAVPVEVVEDSAGYASAIELYQQRNDQLSTEIGDLTEAVLTDVQSLRAQFGQFRQQRRQAIAQQAVQDAVEDFKVYEVSYAATASQLTVAAGNASVA